GGPLSTAFGKAGKRTAIIEREHAGGTCINEGCTPTKTMVASARVAYLARRGRDYGAEGAPFPLNMETVRKRKRDIVDSFRDGSERRIESSENVEYIRGEATFSSQKALTVRLSTGGARALQADTIIINTGARPDLPDVPGLNTIPTLNSTTIMEL